MITLPVKLRKNGFIYTQVLREGNKAIYEQHVTPDLKYFEVFIIRIRQEKIIAGKTIPAGETFPKDEDFGYTAWTFRDYDRALNKYDSLPK
jgi:hypothetical protein